jgi:predicted GNAT family acetyltransferase
VTVLRRAVQKDSVAIEAFLAQHPETSMFLRGNLAAHGLDNSEHRHGTTYWFEERGEITGIIGCTNGGYLMCQAPTAARSFWDRAAEVLLDRNIEGLTGVPAQVNAWIGALGLKSDAFSIKVTEPLYRLPLDALREPDMANLVLRKPLADDFALLMQWFDGYAQDTGIAPTDGSSGKDAAAVFTAHEAARIREQGGTPVAMTSLNAQVADTVQVGGVYVPPGMRGQVLGGAVVAAQLAELRSQGTRLAILFAANVPAARAYERIGFRHIGSYEIALLKSPHKVGSCS